MATRKEIGKKNRAAGQRFELKVRKYLEEKGWIVDKWTNNIELELTRKEAEKMYGIGVKVPTRMHPAKHKFRGPGIPMSIGTGFPDFIAIYRTTSEIVGESIADNLNRCEGRVDYRRMLYEVIGVEVKSNGYLDKKEKEKCSWLLKNHIFSRILIAKKGEKRGEIIYKEFEDV